MNPDDLAQLFTDNAAKDARYLQALDLVRRNSSGKIWLIGGYLSRNLAHELYGTGEPAAADFDFVAEHVNDQLDAPASWQIKRNRFDNPKFVFSDSSVDLVPLGNFHYIRRLNLEPTIENLLSGAPLTLQAIAYDIESNELIGATGIQALLTKTVGINEPEQAKIRAEMKGMTVEQWIKSVAASFNFRPEMTIKGK